MKLREISKPTTVKTLNENLAKMFNTTIDVDTFTLEQLQDARNKLRTTLSQIETNESFDAPSNNASYQKNKMFLDVLNQAIAERSIQEGGIQDRADAAFADMDSGMADMYGMVTNPAVVKILRKAFAPLYKKGFDDGDIVQALYNRGHNTAEKIMKFANQIYQKSKAKGMAEGQKKDQNGDGKNDFKDVQIARMIKSGMSKPEAIAKVNGKKSTQNSSISRNQKSIVEGEEDKAELVMAAKDMVDRITAWMEDTAEMQTESMLELGDAIRDELGQEQSQTFIDSVKPALEALYQALESTRGTLTQGVTMLTGEEMPAPMGAEPGMEEPGMEEPGMEPTVDAEAEMGDEFAAAEPSAGGMEETGREQRESIRREFRKARIIERQNLSRSLGQILSSKKN
jgi:outer membrane protein OmpA-like peptidoglycan-associated protein